MKLIAFIIISIANLVCGSAVMAYFAKTLGEWTPVPILFFMLFFEALLSTMLFTA